MKLGFQFVPFPREIWTENIALTQAEFRLLGWLCCNLKFGVQQLKFTDEQILNGVSLPSYSYPPVGLSRNSMQSARDGLIHKNLVVAEQVNQGGGRGRTSDWLYSLNLSDFERNTDKPLNDGAQTSQELTLKLANFEKNRGVISRYRETTEESELTLSPPSSEHSRKTDPRYPEFIEALSQGYQRRQWSFGFDGRAGKQLKALLKTRPAWKVEDFRRALKFYFESEGVVPGEMPHILLPNLPRYWAGPLDCFGKLRSKATPVATVDKVNAIYAD